MPGKSNIEWCTDTWNPIRGCSRKSPGCQNCYAERQAIRQIRGAYAGLIKRTSHGPAWTGVLRFVPELLEVPLRWRQPRRVFVNSMSDLFHENVSDETIDQVFAVMALCQQHTFQILTKRPERMLRYCRMWLAVHQPLPNVWLGVSVENQETANERIPLLLKTPAAVRFVSYEPALGPVRFPTCTGGPGCTLDGIDGHSDRPLGGLDWVIVGGESGPGARPCDIAWIRSAVEQCKAAGVPCFVKQMGAHPLHYGALHTAASGTMLDKHRIALRDRKGGDPSEWPEDLRVREFPRR